MDRGMTMSNNRRKHVCECCAEVFACNGADLPKYRVIYDGMNFTICSYPCAAKILKAHMDSKSVRPMDLLVAKYPGRRLLGAGPS